ncbi:MAG: arabinogalactan endo-1,4-beta-galactosidase, partial [Bacteroidia bacterium]
MKPILFVTIAFFLVTSFSCKEEKTPVDGRIFYDTDRFVMGADLSYANQILDVGGVYRDSGAIKNPYLIFSQYGTNVVRLRLWHNPVWTSELYPGQEMGIYNGLDDVKIAISESKKFGMKVCLDFHYSDNWADPSKQVVPAAWE